jgi:hypothetical protein
MYPERQEIGMNKTTIHVVAALTVASACFSLSACSFFGSGGDPLEVLRAEVISIVHDEERAEVMLADVDKLDQLLLESAELLSEMARQQRMLFVDYDSTPQEFETLFSEAFRKRRALQEAMLDVHLDFKDKATTEEWEELLPIHANAIAARVNSLVNAAIDERG